MRTALALCALVAATSTTSASQWTWLSLGAKEPRNTILTLEGVDSANARASARIEEADAIDHCQNFMQSDVAGCAARLLEEEQGRIYTASANCLAGTITTVRDRNYTLAGYWQGDWGNGRTRWKDREGNSVGSDNASGGLGISQQWEVLCPNSHPAVELAFTPGSATNGIVGIDHNGSLMWHDENSGVLYYEKPKAALSGLITPGTVLFHGDPWSFEHPFEMSGTAYTFRKGCDPAPYHVTGGFVPGNSSSTSDRIVLKGAAPVREAKGCRVISYTTNSSNAVLEFSLNYGDV